MAPGVMLNCFINLSSPALAMLARLKWLIKQSAMSSARISQRNEGWDFSSEGFADEIITCLEWFLPSGLCDQMLCDELFVQRYAQPRSVGHRDPTALCLNFFVSKLMAHGRILHAVFKQKRIVACGEPVQARSHRDRTGVAMVAEP